MLLSNVTEQSPTETKTSIIIEQEDGTEKHIVLATSQPTVDSNASTGLYLLLLLLLMPPQVYIDIVITSYNEYEYNTVFNAKHLLLCCVMHICSCCNRDTIVILVVML